MQCIEVIWLAGSGTCTMILASGVKQKKAVIKLLIIRFH